jgi:hypothetical protein
LAVPISYPRRVQRKLPRFTKSVSRWMGVAAERAIPATRAVFVVGAQRSGTRLPLQVLDSAPEIMTYNEGSAPYFDGVLLRDLDEVGGLLRRSPFPVVVLKPICESHRTLELLDRFPGSRAIWIFRNYQDTVNSASAKWRSGPEMVRRLAEGEASKAGWSAGGLTTRDVEFVREVYRPGMSIHAANAVLWYLRNNLYFTTGSSQHPGVLLVQYEQLVGQPRQAFERVFAHIGLPSPGGFDRDVYASSVSKRPFPEIPAAIKDRCDDLEARLIAVAHQSNR